MPATARVVVYTTSSCPYCVRAKALLSARAIPYQEFDVSHDAARRQWLVKTTGQYTVPQIFIDERPVGGCDDLYALDRGGELARLLGEAGGRG